VFFATLKKVVRGFENNAAHSVIANVCNRYSDEGARERHAAQLLFNDPGFSTHRKYHIVGHHLEGHLAAPVDKIPEGSATGI
jgi:hypothetical protein